MIYSKFQLVFLMILFVAMSCTKREDLNQVPNQSVEYDSVQKSATANYLDRMLRSTAIVQFMSEDNESDSMIVHLQFFIYDQLESLPTNIIVDNVRYSDDGRGNDRVAGDGIYSSLEKYRTTYDEKSYVHTAEDFVFDDELAEDFSAIGGGIAIACDIGTAECPETSWLNTCWPLSSPCTCVTFSNCHAEISFGW